MRRYTRLLSFLSLLSLAVPVCAQTWDDDHDHARAARLRGDIQPIAAILQQVAAQVPGEVIEIELEQETRAGQRRWIYELKILTPEGNRLEIEADARDGRILELEDED